jgi:hypothetical protein
VASWPVTGTLPLSLFFFSTVMAALPRPSLAASTPAIFDSLVSICSKSVPAWALSQSGTDCSGPLTYSPASNLGLSTPS